MDFGFKSEKDICENDNNSNLLKVKSNFFGFLFNYAAKIILEFWMEINTVCLVPRRGI